MLIPFIIYARAIGLYLLFTIPVLLMPIMYFISAMYVLFYGWFAWALFTIIYLCSGFLKKYEVRMLVLVVAVVGSVAFAFQMLQVLSVEENVWNSGGYLLFPATAVLAGWTSLLMSAKSIKTVYSRDEWVPEFINVNQQKENL